MSTSEICWCSLGSETISDHPKSITAERDVEGGKCFKGWWQDKDEQEAEGNKEKWTLNKGGTSKKKKRKGKRREEGMEAWQGARAGSVPQMCPHHPGGGMCWVGRNTPPHTHTHTHRQDHPSNCIVYRPYMSITCIQVQHIFKLRRFGCLLADPSGLIQIHSSWVKAQLYASKTQRGTVWKSTNGWIYPCLLSCTRI